MNKRVILSFIIFSVILLSAVAQTGNVSMLTSREGWSVGIEGSYGESRLESRELSSQLFENDGYTWESIPGNGFMAEVNGYYFFNSYFGIKTGIVYNSYSSNFQLDGHFQDSEYSVDLNKDLYYEVRETIINSDIKLSYFSLPVVANLILGKPGRNGLFFEGGFLLEQKFMATNHFTGSYEVYGFYPDHPPVTQIIKINELGFYSLNDIDKTENIVTSFFNISGYLSFGLNLAFGYNNTVRIGAELIYGIRNMEFGDEYERFFDAPVDLPVTFKKYGLKIGYIRKLGLF